MIRGLRLNRAMKFFHAFLAVSLFHAVASFDADGQWRPADGPLKTRWTSQVSPDNVWSEYPRPQMERKTWLNLNGLWDYAIVDAGAGAPQSYDGKILVPFPIESALSGVMKQLDERHNLIYRRAFQLPPGWAGQRVLLHFGAVDWETSVMVNGKKIGDHRGGYDPFSFDITDAIKSGPAQEIVVSVFDPTEGGQPRGKQVRKPNGIWYTSSSGIWQTAWLEPVPPSHIAGLIMTPDLNNDTLRLNATTVDTSDADAIEAIALDHGKEVARARGAPGTELQIRIRHPNLWSPDYPFLYDLQVQLLRAGKQVDSVASYFGMRKIDLEKDDKGITRPMLNGDFVFQIGPLDQGFWPDGIYTAPTDAAMRYDLEVIKQLGFNMTRKHVKVEPDRWYYYCDKLGLMVWQDMPSANNTTEEDKQEFERELKQLVATHFNHPSIIMWVVFNEGWGQFDTERLTKMVKEMDPSRLVNDATGWTDKKAGDVIDIHKYPGPASPKPESERAAVLGEFGGLGLPIDGHTWARKSWGYKGMASADVLTEQYLGLLQKVWGFEQSPGLSAAVYTQITDVETECNGLMTYDREIIKPDPRKVAAANRGQFVGP
jgi:beta-galactosidase/beta-glucuronidase